PEPMRVHSCERGHVLIIPLITDESADALIHGVSQASASRDGPSCLPLWDLHANSPRTQGRSSARRTSGWEAGGIGRRDSFSSGAAPPAAHDAARPTDRRGAPQAPGGTWGAPRGSPQAERPDDRLRDRVSLVVLRGRAQRDEGGRV